MISTILSCPLEENKIFFLIIPGKEIDVGEIGYEYDSSELTTREPNGSESE